jgi:hypothetical protein
VQENQQFASRSGDTNWHFSSPNYKGISRPLIIINKYPTQHAHRREY